MKDTAIPGAVVDFAARFFAAEIRAWQGAQPLWLVFWLYGVIVSTALIAVYIIAFFVNAVALRQVLLLCFGAYTGWLVVSIWRCADNTREPSWATLARFLAVAWACNTALMLVFLQLNLITRYYLAG